MKFFTISLAALLPTALSIWIDNEDLKAKTLENVTAQRAPVFTLNLDLPASERWNDIAALYKDEAYKVTDYLKSQLPPWAYPVVVALGADVLGYFKDYGDEMVGVAQALGLEIGEVVALNLVYELERIGVNCSNWNNTGPTRDDDAIPHGLSCADQRDAFEAKRLAVLETGPEGLCTSIVTQAPVNEEDDGTLAVQHGRNLDWNIPDALKDFVVDLVVVRDGGQEVYRGTGAVGFVGMLNGMRTKGERWSVSQNARNHGGYVPVNLLEALAAHALTPEQALRKALEDDSLGGTGFEHAVASLSQVDMICDVYFTMAGAGSVGEGLVVTRARNEAVDVWRIGTDPDTPPQQDPVTPSDDWFCVETNYDHWEPVPKADDRNGPANDMMHSLGGPQSTTYDAFFQVLVR
mmetsp:Transcript_54094/g.93145  ORF Transcript_54094/g.93145 Transcript_54094/m.93145 type:complete len:406 (-) Transcript_54094:612-1829(-)